VTAGARLASAPRSAIRRRFRGASAGYLLVAPAVLATVVFLLIPMVVSLYWSFTTFNGIRPPVFVGLDNYRDLLNSRLFTRAFQNTTFFVVFGMAIGPALGLASATLLDASLRFRAAFRAAFFLPTMTSLVVVATIWKLLYGSSGLVNTVIGFFGLPGHDWLSDPTTALPAVVVTSIWQGFGFETVVFLAALQGIPREYYEAATVDGAGRWAKFRYVTLPGLRPTILFVYVIGIIGSFQVFDQIFVMTFGGPLQATRTIVYDLYDRFFKLDLGGASAVAYILLVFLAILSFIQLRLGESRD
jgi:multiple sugar transport system permease protein